MAIVTADTNRTFTFVWRIENFRYILKNKEEYALSPNFKICGLSRISKWSVKIILNSTENLDVRLINEEDDSSILCDWEFSFLDGNATPIFTSERVKNYNSFQTQTSNIPLGPSQENVFVTKKSEYLPNDMLTFRLRLWLSGEYMPLDDEYSFYRTVIGREKSSIIWRIEKFGSIPLGARLEKNLYFQYCDNTSIILFSLMGLSLQFATLKFRLYSDNDLKMSCKISVLDVKKTPSKLFEDCCKFEQRENRLVWFPPTFLTMQQILSNRTQWLDDDVLCLLLEFEINIFSHTDTVFYSSVDIKRDIQNISRPKLAERGISTAEDKVDKANPAQQRDHAVIALMKDYLSLYKEPTLCDFELRCKDKTFKAHKVVLHARSQFFRNLFSNNTETDQSYHEVPDLDGRTINMMLIFLYGCMLPSNLTWQQAIRLYISAVKYQIESLKYRCSAILMFKISILNACDYLILANRHGDSELRSFVEDFLVENLNEIIHSSKWKEFLEKNKQLGFITMQNLLERSSAKKPRHDSSPSPSCS